MVELLRALVAAWVVVMPMAACDLVRGEATLVQEKLPVRTAILTVAPNTLAAVYGAIRSFAERNGFEMRARTIRSQAGDNNTFELRRRDLWIIGGSVLLDNAIDVELGSDGLPEVENQFDQRRYEVSFYPGEIEPEQQTINGIFADFTRSLEGVATVEVRANP